MGKYDPNKSYSWKPGDEFIMTGEDFGLFLQASKVILQTEEAAKVVLFQKVNSSLQGILARAVDNDIVEETPETKT